MPVVQINTGITAQSKYFYSDLNLNPMIEGKRQKQVAAVLEKELNEIFQRLGLNMIDGGMVSIASVKITPDLYDARIYLSFFQVQHKEQTLKHIRDKSWEIKKELTARVRHQLRSMPLLNFFVDDTLEYVDKMEKLFKEIHQNDPDKTNPPADS
jgi:ribosome-binding factor A